MRFFSTRVVLKFENLNAVEKKAMDASREAMRILGIKQFKQSQRQPYIVGEDIPANNFSEVLKHSFSEKDIKQNAEALSQAKNGW